MLSLLMAIIRYRGFISGAVKRDFQARYRTSMLGAVWLVIQPLAMITVYTLIFAEVMKSKLPGVAGQYSYSIYICSGLLLWGFFAEICGKGSSLFIDNANLLKKVSFPRITLPVILVLTSLINFAIIFGLFLIFLVLIGDFRFMQLLLMVPVVLTTLALAAGLTMVLAVLNVFFRDIGQLFTIVLQFWFWFTPIVYPLQIIPQWARGVVEMNPMAITVGSMHDIFVNNQAPEWTPLLNVSLVGFLLMILGLYLFRRHSGDMVDEL
ncbi:ABC transporter permease [Pantoea sp. CFSAN033090]|uniref:ABC transporter permease n=1 Tax=Pantoea sp. CFSAN033090 TaxID=1690502 RepID=UPI000691C484|nr:ABC transporter [Pantoea sp. CFSAN033090]